MQQIKQRMRFQKKDEIYQSKEQDNEKENAVLKEDSFQLDKQSKYKSLDIDAKRSIVNIATKELQKL